MLGLVMMLTTGCGATTPMTKTPDQVLQQEKDAWIKKINKQLDVVFEYQKENQFSLDDLASTGTEKLTIAFESEQFGTVDGEITTDYFIDVDQLKEIQMDVVLKDSISKVAMSGEVAFEFHVKSAFIPDAILVDGKIEAMFKDGLFYWKIHKLVLENIPGQPVDYEEQIKDYIGQWYSFDIVAEMEQDVALKNILVQTPQEFIDAITDVTFKNMLNNVFDRDKMMDLNKTLVISYLNETWGSVDIFTVDKESKQDVSNGTSYNLIINKDTVKNLILTHINFIESHLNIIQQFLNTPLNEGSVAGDNVRQKLKIVRNSVNESDFGKFKDIVIVGTFDGDRLASLAYDKEFSDKDISINTDVLYSQEEDTSTLEAHVNIKNMSNIKDSMVLNVNATGKGLISSETQVEFNLNLEEMGTLFVSLESATKNLFTADMQQNIDFELGVRDLVAENPYVQAAFGLKSAKMVIDAILQPEEVSVNLNIDTDPIKLFNMASNVNSTKSNFDLDLTGNFDTPVGAGLLKVNLVNTFSDEIKELVAPEGAVDIKSLIKERYENLNKSEDL